MNTASSSKGLPLIKSLDRDRVRGLGELSVDRMGTRSKLPLQAVDIKAKVADRIAYVTVKETFTNSFTDHMEAVYIFPLSGGCAVSTFEMRVGDRVVKGIVKERQEARAQYQQALQDGKRAALLEQERDDVFTVQVGNVPPGESITVTLTYSERLPFFQDGTTELRLPLVVAPRYIPGKAVSRPSTGDGTESDTNIVPDASRITPPRLAEGFDPKVALGISVDFDITSEDAAGAQSLEDMTCSQHAVRTGLSGRGVSISLSRDDEPLDRDFVLRWRLADDQMKSRLLVYKDPQLNETFAMLTMVPPRRKGFLGLARDVIFVIDRSGSMQGVKMSSAARSCSVLLETLGPSDRYAIVAFDTVNEWMMSAGKSGDEIYFVEADEQGLEHGNKYLRQITARGGTELDGAIAEALKVLKCRTNSSAVPIIVVLTDGEVGDESRVLKRIQRELGDVRVFTVGIDTAVNDGLLRKLAALGGGTATFVEPGVQLEEALVQVGREIGSPLVTDISVDDRANALDKNSLAPARIPDLFQGRPAAAFFKLDETDSVKSKRIKVTGRFADGKTFKEEVKAVEIDMPAIAHLWARVHVSDLEDRFRTEPARQAALKQQIVDVAVRHSLLTRFTAFVVVDEAEIVNATGQTRKVVQPVEMPARWEMATDGSAPPTMAQSIRAKMSYGAAQPSSSSWGATPTSSSDMLYECAPTPAPPAGPASYGSGVRPQVFEVIVRQAMAGAPWQEICSGPMQVNNISPAEVQQEVHRRQQRLSGGGGGKDENLPPRPSSSLMGQLAGPSKPQQVPGSSTPQNPPADPSLAEGGAPPEAVPPPPPASAEPTPHDQTTTGSHSIVSPPSGAPQPGSQPHATPPRTGKFGEIIDALAKAFRGRGAQPRDLSGVSAALERFFSVFSEALIALSEGESVDAVELEKARKDLLDALSLWEDAHLVPKLQRFLRLQACEIVAAVRAESAASLKLQDLARAHGASLNEAFDEIRVLLSGAGGGGNFWESSI